MSKLVALSNEAYERLQARKNGSDSFSDVVLRVTSKRRLMDFAGILTPEQGKDLERSIRELRMQSRKRDARLEKLL